MTNHCRILVFAYHEVGYRCLETLLAHNQNVVAVFTHNDNPQEKIWFRSVKALAHAHNLPVFCDAVLRSEATFTAIESLAPELILSFYYRDMIPDRILSIPRLGAFNMHGSLLPKYRGRVPINWAIIHGEDETGATLHHMVRRADAGDIVDQHSVKIGSDDTALDVFLKVTDAAVTVLERNLVPLTTGCAPRKSQNDAFATTFGARRPEDGRIDWNLSNVQIFNLVRALTDPYPGAFTTVNGRKLLVWWGRPAQGFSVQAKPGQVIQSVPFTVQTGHGAFCVERCEWADKPTETQSCNFALTESLGS